MVTEKQNEYLQTWFKHSLNLNDQAVISRNSLYEHYCNDIRSQAINGMEPSIPVRPKAFATAIKKHAKSKGFKGKVEFFYSRASQVQGWEYIDGL